MIRQTSPVDYEVETKTGKSDIVHVSTMKRFNEREEVKEKDTRPNNRHPGKETRARGRPRKQLTDHKDEYVPLVTRRHFDNLEKTVEKENFDPPIIQEERRRGRPRKQWNDPYAKHLNSLEKESESQKVKQKRRPRVKEVTDKKYVSIEQRPARRSPRLVNLLLITFFLMKIILVGGMNVVQREGVLFTLKQKYHFRIPIEL